MKIVTGCDIIRIERFTPYLNDTRFLNRCFTETEQKYCFEKVRPEVHFAARFAGKEAVLKALSGFDLRYPIGSLEILHETSGRPSVRILEDAVPAGLSIDVSLSHDGEYAAASAVAYLEG